MPAPKNPNTAAATAAVRRRGQETMAAKLRAVGWTCTPPDPTGAYADMCSQLPGCRYGEHSASCEVSIYRDAQVDAVPRMAMEGPDGDDQ